MSKRDLKSRAAEVGERVLHDLNPKNVRLVRLGSKLEVVMARSRYEKLGQHALNQMGLVLVGLV